MSLRVGIVVTCEWWGMLNESNGCAEVRSGTENGTGIINLFL